MDEMSGQTEKNQTAEKITKSGISEPDGSGASASAA